MKNLRYYDKSEILGYIVLFFIFLAIGYFLGVWIVEIIFTLMSQFFEALRIIVGTIFAIALFIIILFSGSIWYTLRIALYGLFTGVVLSMIFTHPLLRSFGSTYSNTASFWVPLLVIIIILIFLILYYTNSKYTLVKRRELVFGINKKKKG